MDALYNAEGNAQTDVSPFVKRFRTLNPQDTSFVPKDPSHRIDRCVPLLCDLAAGKMFLQGGGGVGTTRPLYFVRPVTPDGKVAARPRPGYCWLFNSQGLLL